MNACLVCSLATRADTEVTVGRDTSRRSGGLRSEGLTRGEPVGPEAREQRDMHFRTAASSSRAKPNRLLGSKSASSRGKPQAVRDAHTPKKREQAKPPYHAHMAADSTLGTGSVLLSSRDAAALGRSM